MLRSAGGCSAWLGRMHLVSRRDDEPVRVQARAPGPVLSRPLSAMRVREPFRRGDSPVAELAVAVRGRMAGVAEDDAVLRTAEQLVRGIGDIAGLVRDCVVRMLARAEERSEEHT